MSLLLNGRYDLHQPISPESRGRLSLPARDALLGREVVVELLSALEPGEPEAWDCFPARVHHPNLVRVFDYGVIQRGPVGTVRRRFLAREAIEGESLRARLDRLGRLDPTDVAALALDVLSALETSHSVGLIHGFLNPATIAWRDSGEAVLLGLGLGELERPPELAAYRGPEHERLGVSDERSDLYALGASLYEALCGRVPDLQGAIPMRDLRPEVPLELERAIARLLLAEPRARAESTAAARASFATAAGTERPLTVLGEVEPRFVGREAAWQTIQLTLEEAQALAAAGRSAREEASSEGAPPLLVLHGDQGVGKSRLLSEAATRLARRGTLVLTARVFEGGEPYDVWRELLGRAPSEGTETGKVALGALEPSSPLAPQARHEYAARFLVELAQREPVALLIDDAHLLTGPALELLVHVSRAAAAPGRGGALAIVLAAQPSAGSGLDRILAQPMAPPHAVHRLAELSPSEAEQLIRSVGPNPTEVADLVRLGGGDPFLLSELAHEHRLGGGTPASAEDLVRARLERVETEHRALLDALAVVGRPVDARALDQMVGAPTTRALQALAALGLIHTEAGGWGLRHGITRTVLLSALPEPQQQELCGRALEALSEAPLGERARLALLARSERAVELALAAAAEDPAPEELYEAVLELLPAGRTRAGVGQRLAEHRRQRGELSEARRALEAAAEDLGPDASPLELAPIQLALGQVASEEGDTNEALEWAARGRRRLEGAQAAEGSGAILARLYALEARVAALRSDYPAAARLLAKAKDLAGQAEPRLAAQLLIEEGTAITLSLDKTRYPRARDNIERALRLLFGAGDVAGEIEGIRALGNHAYYSGDVAAAEEHYRVALELCEEQADLTLAAGLWNNLGLAARDGGDLRSAEAALERALDLAERIGQATVTCRALTNMGRVRRSLGDLRGAERSYLQAAELAQRVGEPVIASAALSELGHARLEEGRYRAALNSYKRSRRLRLKLGDPGRVAESELELAELWRSAGDVRAALGGTVRSIALEAAMGDADGAALAVEALEFVAGRPGGPSALLALVRRQVKPSGPPPVRDGMRRGAWLGRLARRTLAAALTARAGDAEQARAQSRLAQRAARSLAKTDLAPAVQALGQALALEAEAVALAGAGQLDDARGRLDAALVALGDQCQVRRGAVRLKRAFLNLALGEVGQAVADALGEADPKLTPALAERRGVGRALLVTQARRRGAVIPAEPLVSLPGLADCEEAARRLGDVALAAMVATARAEDAALEGNAREAARERTSARIAAERLASGLPGSLRDGLARASAPPGAVVVKDASSGGSSGLLAALAERLLAQGVDLEPLLDALLSTLTAATGAPQGVIALALGDAGPSPLRHHGLPEQDALPPLLAAAVDNVWREGRPLLALDVQAEPRLKASARRAGSLLAIPLGHGGRRLGVAVLSHPRPGGLDTAARDLALELGEQLAGPLELACQRSQRQGERSRRAEALRETEHELGPDSGDRTLVGRGPAMRVVLRLIERYGRTSAPVTIQGESGTGKELVAKALHAASACRDGPFIALNCSAVSETLLESELFGVAKGAYTGADRDRKGLFELADQGCLFLDEVADMSLEMQAKLLRVLETGELRPVGGRALVEVDVRIISASHRDLRRCVAEGTFREDLFYRLNVLRLELPPLRDRREDMPILTEHFLALAAKGDSPKRLAPAALEILLRHPFPGNVRELRNVLDRACILEPGPVIGVERLLLDTPRLGLESQPTTPAYHKTFRYQGVDLNRRQRQVLDHLASGVSAITNREYCGLTSVSERTGLRDLIHLVEQGLLERLGKRKGARYQLATEDRDGG